MSFTAVIRLTGFNENPHRALVSIEENKYAFSDVVIVNPFYVSDQRMYPNYVEDKAAIEAPYDLGNGNMRVVTVTQVEEFNVAHCKGYYVLEIPPHCEFKRGAVELLHTQVGKSTVHQTHLGLSTSTLFQDFSIMYGFVVICQVMSWYWTRIWERGKLYQYTDLRCTAILQRGKTRFVAPSQFSWRFWNNGCIPVMYGAEVAICKPQQRGWEYVVWLLHTHTNFTWGLWLFPYSFFYIIYSLAGLGLFYYRNWDSFYMLAVYFVEVVSTVFICQSYTNLRHIMFYALMFPLYWIAFPFILVFSKSYVPQQAWTK